ncbi:lytic transglycosylase domain-containing protein [Sphingomonas solaris]|nr:lytic transglycosylase domain-containing protein [Sphingomonas solaris]
MLKRSVLLITLALLPLAAPAAAETVGPTGSGADATVPGAESETFKLIEHRIAAPAGGQPFATAPTATPRPESGARWKLSSSVAGARARVLAIIRSAELRHALPGGLLDALISVESQYRPDAASRAGAMGLTQLMPRTAQGLGVLNPFDERANVDGGARFLKAMLDKFGSITLALAAYNAGPSAVLRVGGVPANGETPAYVRKVFEAWQAVGF